MILNRSRIREGFLAGAAYTLIAYGLAAGALLLFLLLSQADAKPVTQQFEDLKVTYKAEVAGTTADNILPVLVDTKGNALSKFKVAVSAAPSTRWALPTISS